jgi:hypothetical protein
LIVSAGRTGCNHCRKQLALGCLNPDNDETGLDGADNENPCAGADNDNSRCTALELGDESNGVLELAF